LRKAAAKTSSEDEKSKQVRLRFLLNPVQFIPDSAVKSRLGSVLCERTRLEGELGNQVAVGTGEMEEITANMALVSIGYKGLQLPGMNDALFDEKTGVVRNTNGKVHSKSNLYASGWLKRGPSGIIGTNISDAKDTVSSIVNDLRDIAESKVDGRVGLDSLLSERNIQVIDWESYQRIDAAEKDTSRLRSDGQPREKFTNVDEMLNYK
jgi:adrenodoxin-NADP+ reductase